MQIVNKYHQGVIFTHKGSEYTLEILSGGFARLYKGKEALGITNIASRDEALLWAGALVGGAPKITCDYEHPNYTVTINGETVFVSAHKSLRNEFYERIQLHVKGEEPPKLLSEQLQTLDEQVKQRIQEAV